MYYNKDDLRGGWTPKVGTLSIGKMHMNNSTIIKAVRATIAIGEITLDCLQFPDGSYHFSQSEIEQKLGIRSRNKTGQKYLKSILDKDSRLVTTAKVEGENQRFKTWSLDLLTDAVAIYAVELKNDRCIALMAACFAESLERRADHAFNVKRTEQERNAQIELRYQRVMARRAWTDVIKERHHALYGEYPQNDVYKELTIKVNLTLFNQPHFKCDRDTMTPHQQKTIYDFESMCQRVADKYPLDTPDKLIEKALITF